jgi:hypothetical protein
MTVAPDIYRITGAAPGSAAVVTSLSFGAWDSNASLESHAVKRGASGRSYVVTLAIGSDVSMDATRFKLWGVLSGGSLDANVTVDIATALKDTYIQATGTLDDHGNTLVSIYGGAVEDFLAYTALAPKYISGTDVIKTTGTGLFTKYIPLQINVGASAALGEHPADPVTLYIYAAAAETS